MEKEGFHFIEEEKHMKRMKEGSEAQETGWTCVYIFVFSHFLNPEMETTSLETIIIFIDELQDALVEAFLLLDESVSLSSLEVT